MLSLTHLWLSHALSLLSNEAKRNSDFYIISRALSQFLLPITNNCTLCCHSILPNSNIVVAPDCVDDSHVPLTPHLIDEDWCLHSCPGRFRHNRHLLVRLVCFILPTCASVVLPFNPHSVLLLLCLLGLWVLYLSKRDSFALVTVSYCQKNIMTLMPAYLLECMSRVVALALSLPL
jgi:hypothetical protein